MEELLTSTAPNEITPICMAIVIITDVRIFYRNVIQTPGRNTIVKHLRVLTSQIHLLPHPL